MENEIKWKAMKHCRGCLTSCTNMKPFDLYSENFNLLTGVKMVRADSIFDWLCSDCCLLLHRFQAFKQQAQRVNELLQSHSNSSQNDIKFDKVFYEKNFSNQKTLKSVALNVLQICNECTLNDNNIVPKYHTTDNDGIIAIPQNSTNTSFNNTHSNKFCDNNIIKCFIFDYNDTLNEENYKSELLTSDDDDKTDVPCELSDINDVEFDESKERKKIRKRYKNKPNFKEIGSQGNFNIKSSTIAKKNKKREWISKTLDMKAIKVINLTIDEQIKEIEDRRVSKNFCDARYKCEFCVKIFPYTDSLENHMQRHDKLIGNFTCNICQQRFKEKRVLKNHINTHSRRYQCLKCGRLLHFKTTMANHLLRHENMYICHVCGHRSKDKESNREHQKTHSSSESFKCSICPKVLNNKHDYGVHIRRHTGDMPFSCTECGKCFQTGATLAAHKSVHSSTREFYCASCDVSFKTREIMLAHFRKSAKHIDPAILIYSCDQCQKKFESESQRAAHIDRYHLRSVQLFCDMCPARFVSANGLRNHRRRKHEGLRPTLAHVCETCGRGFSTKTLVTNHLRTHTGERPFECETCHRCFSQKSAMQTHIKLVHLKQKRNRNKQNANLSNESTEKIQFEQSKHWLNPVAM